VIVLEQLPQEDDIPSDVLVHILSIYNRAAQGLRLGLNPVERQLTHIMRFTPGS